MALVLNSTLAAAQDAQTRRPLVEILSGAFVPDVPFDGQFLDEETLNERRPNMIPLSSGRIAVVFGYGETAARYVYTDEERLEFFTAAIPNSTGYAIEEVVLTELTSGNVGIVLLEQNGANWLLSRQVVSPTGETVVSRAVVATYARSSYWIGKPAVYRLQNGTYVLVYGYATGGTYSLQKRTSADFLTWSAASACSIGGLDDAKRRDNPSLIQDTHGDLFLFFDYLNEVSGTAERTNIYYSVSADNGATWSSAVALTSYDDFTVTGLHPVAVQKVADQIEVIFYEQYGALHMDTTTPGWTDNGSVVRGVSFDPVSRKVYAVTNGTNGVMEIDLDTWEVTNMWDDGSIPSLPAHLFTGQCTPAGHDERYFITLMWTGSTKRSLYVINAQANTIQEYHFSDYAPYGIVTNVTGLQSGPHAGTTSIMKTWIDFNSMRLYIYFHHFYTDVITNIVGYIDLAQPGPTYTFNQIVTHTWNYYSTGKDVVIVPEENLAIVACAGYLFVYSLTSGNLIKSYSYADDASFPFYGLNNICYRNRNIYGTFIYTTLYGQEDYRGLCKINLDDDSIIFYRPTWATLDDYKLRTPEPIDTGEIVLGGEYGATKFNPADGSWILYSNATIPGFTPDGVYDLYDVAYDAATGTLLTGSGGAAYNWKGLIAWNVNGFIRQSMVMLGTKSGTWSFGSPEDFIQGLYDYETTAAVEPGSTGLYAFWTRQEGAGMSLAWDKEAASFGVTDFIVDGTDVTIKRTIDGAPARLSFTVSHGHLFDPHNFSSLLSPYLKKFRKVTVRFGEKIGGSDYWQNMGTFAVTGNRLSFKRGQYPTMSVEAEDKRAIWEGVEIIATQHYEAYPEAIIQDILTRYVDELVGDIALPNFDGRYVVWRQWLDTSVKKMIEEIAERFGYYLRVTVDDDVSARKISDENPVDHAYTDLKTILSFTPDDSFSDFTNRVVVVGESRDFVDVLMDEESIQSLSGTVGWFGHKKKVKVWYSEDHTKRCRNPRLEIIESVKNFNFRLGGGGESITDTDIDFLWVEVTIEMPNLVPEAIGLVAAITALGFACGSSIFVAGWCFAALCVLLGGLFYIVSSFALYQYNLHARPMGKERTSIQAEANDLALQAAIGKVVTKKLEEPLCITVFQCAEVAEHELMIARLQRNRVKLSKVGHLQDEEGDTITFPHPYSGATKKMFITDMTRTYSKPAESGGDGGLYDELEGWVL